ncbi:MAG: hypothetical protein PUA81_09760 [Oscillospiraceae bacterium]|nr:hypothetical protein [Oscillospiraceae bacterium]
MTKYLKAYIDSVEKKLASCQSLSELNTLFDEHKDKIIFMQHERIVHFLVTLMFALILSIFVAALLFIENIALLILVTIIIVLLGAYIKHYYFLENTVQHMYVIYDEMLCKMRDFTNKEADND